MIYFILCSILTPLVWILLSSPSEPYSPEEWADKTQHIENEYFNDWDYMNPDKYC